MNVTFSIGIHVLEFAKQPQQLHICTLYFSISRAVSLLVQTVALDL